LPPRRCLVKNSDRRERETPVELGLFLFGVGRFVIHAALVVDPLDHGGFSNLRAPQQKWIPALRPNAP
jgi:hypothetical protein